MASRLAIAVLLTAGLAAPALARAPASEPRLVAEDVVWPDAAIAQQVGDNGISVFGGLASVDSSTQYGLTAVTADAGVVRFSYADAWTIRNPNPSRCDFTIRAVERALTQDEANALSQRLAGVEREALKTAHADLTAQDGPTREGARVARWVDRVTWKEGDLDVWAQGKTWIFLAGGKGIYVNKLCRSYESDKDVVVIDQLIGLTYHPDTGVAAPVAEPTPGA